MPVFQVTTRVNQLITRTVDFTIEAATKEEAEEKAKNAIHEYPKPIAYDPMIHRIITRDTTYWVPRDIEFLEMEDNQGASA